MEGLVFASFGGLVLIRLCCGNWGLFLSILGVFIVCIIVSRRVSFIVSWVGRYCYGFNSTECLLLCWSLPSSS